MRVVGIETSSPRGTVALLDGESLILLGNQEEAQAHGERLQGLLDGLIAESGWSRTSIDRLAVGTGPGSFTGLRVGIAFSQGIGLGLDRPVVGVGSQRAMAAAVPSSFEGARCPLLDARRGEAFLAVYAPHGEELLVPTLVGRDQIDEVLATVPSAHENRVLIGALAAELGPRDDVFRSPATDLPSAEWTARVAASVKELDPALAQYVRPADAIPPKMPPSPLSSSCR